MFRRSTYEQVGGYRAVFPVAQDLDLWMRVFGGRSLLRHAGGAVSGEAGRPARSLRHGAIEQIQATQSIMACAAARRAGKSEAEDLSALANRVGRVTGPRCWRPETLHGQRARSLLLFHCPHPKAKPT